MIQRTYQSNSVTAWGALLVRPAERWNRTMKNIMWKYFTAKNTQNYVDVLPSMVEKYNNTYHRSIKLTPSEARNSESYQHVHNALYAKINARKATSTKFHVGDKKTYNKK